MRKIKEFFNKISSLNLNTKLRILYSFLFVFIIVVGLITCFTTYSEPTIAFEDDEDYIESQILENVVYVNDLEMDLNYYEGANYTYNDGTLPTNVDKNIYNEKTLVQTKITYSGYNENRTLHGYVSINENQDTYIYFKVFPVNDNGTDSINDDYVKFELIDNPFTDRPTNKGFNGWVTNYSGAELSFDSTYYVRYVKIPVTYTNDKPNAIEIDFYSSWVDATVANIETSNTSVWNNMFNQLKAKQMVLMETTNLVYPTEISGYYRQLTINRNASCNGYYNANGVLQNNCTCNSNRCTYYELLENETFNQNTTYYELNGTMRAINNNDLRYLEVKPEFANSNMASFYRLVHLNRYDSYEGYYNSTGVIQTTGTCGTAAGCDYYELIQYYDESGNANTIDPNEEYYYLVTRDTNIVVLQYNLSYTWANTNDKPFTFTGAYNGTNYGRMWTVTSRQVQIYNDTTIENMIIYANNAYTGDYDPPLNATNGSIFANFKNLKIGRGILRNTSITNNRPCFRAVVGGIGNTGSNGNPTKYRLIIESGMYNSMAMVKGSSTSSTNNMYVLAQAIYGNDYDRVAKNNNNLQVYYTAAGSFSGRIYASTNSQTSTEVAMDLIVKSGQFGTGKYDYTTGIYVGGLTGGTHYAAKRAKIEGGWIYNLIGGPLTYNGRGSVNDVYMNITGGSIDMIIGGAGQTATYGNRIISVTGGTINYSVFGGSNSYNGSSTDGTLVGTPFIYIGGNAIIGNESYVNSGSTLWNAEAGSVFGIGNGKSGTSALGSADNSNIIIDGDATILRNVYGGGNFGATGTSRNIATTTSNILLNGGFISGDVYGGGNRNGSGDSNTKATINITMNAGNVVGSIYGGSNELGTIYGDVNVNILGGEVTNNVYGGGRGGYQSSNSTGTFVGQKVNVTIGQSDVSNLPIINGSVYGGSAFGTVNGTTRTTNLSSYPTTVTVNNGIITNVFGGGQGDGSYTPYVEGNITVTINDGDIGNVYGGNDAAGSPNGSITVYLNGGTVDNTFGGGRATDAKTTNVYLQGGTSTNIFGGSDTSGVVNTSNVICTSGTATTVYGGNNLGGSTGTTNVTINGGNITTVYGGGEKTNVTSSANVTLRTEVETLFGGSNTAGTVTESNILVEDGTVKNIYGGNNDGGTTITTTMDLEEINASNVYGGGKKAPTTTSTVNFDHGTANNVFGGGSEAGVTTTNVNLKEGTIGNVYGGSDMSGTVTTSNVKTYGTNITDSNLDIGTLYGGNNAGGVTTNANIDVNHGDYDAIYGGGKAAITGTSDVNVNSAIINNNFFGGGDAASITSVVANISSSTIGSDSSEGNVYGGGNEADVDSVINLKIDGNTTIYGNVYGGGNNGSTGGKITTDIKDTKIIANSYGGGNNGDALSDVSLSFDNVEVNAIYGGGNNADVSGDIELKVHNATVKSDIYGGGNVGATGGSITADIKNTNVINNIYGGGNNGDVGDDVSLTIDSTKLVTIYGGGNKAGVDGNITLTIKNQSEIADSIYGGGNEGVTTGSIITDISSSIVTNNIYGGGNNGNVGADVSLTIDSTELTTVYGGGNNADVSGNINLSIKNNSKIKDSVYGGGNEGETLGGTTSILEKITVTNNIYGGGNKAGVGSGNSEGAKLSLTSVTVCDVYGGGRSAITNGDSEVSITSSTINCNVFGGGNGEESVVAGDATGEQNPAKVTGNASVLISDSTTIAKSVYGGGNLGFVLGNAELGITNSSIQENVYGGGNAARVKGSTEVKITSTSIGESLYAGGNGATAVVEGSTNLTIDGITKVTKHVFGGGNAAATGLEANNNSTGIVNIAGLEAGGNVYGGANTSVLYGSTTLNIGAEAINNPSLITSDIIINGTVFGGGEANASGSEVYDYSFISVTVGIEININGLNHDTLTIGGSIFGSGNASSTTGYSYIYINNYGSEEDVKYNISIQRADVVSLSNSHVKLSGATDRTNEYSDVLFSLSRIDELKLKNDSALYLRTGSNLVKKFSSLVDVDGVEQKATVDINDETKTVTRNVNNRLYLLEDKNLNIALNEKITSYGDVYGMTFFGMYRENSAGKIITALYSNDYDYGDMAAGGDAYYFTSGSYVLGRHYESHDITVDGFYSNDLVSEESTEIKVYYIEPTPADADFYMWVVGEQVVTYDITLTASKYSTLGVEELSLINYSKPNTSFSILGFNYDGLALGASLVESADIPRIAPTSEQADMKMGLAMQTGQSGWITIGNTEFVSNSNSPVVGTKLYQKENSTLAPSFLFYLYHSKNIASEGEVGTVSISLVAITPVDDLNNEVERININVTLTRALYNTNDYEATMTTGKKYSMFASSVVDITTTSSLSAYYSLFMEKETNPYREGDYRALVSTYLLPVNTKITMIDFDFNGQPTYYYYVVNQADYNAAKLEFDSIGEASYKLSKFIKMGSTSSNNNYNDALANIEYYSESQQLSMEEFIFIVDFKESNITSNVIGSSLLIELRNKNNQTIVSVLGIEQADMVYDLYHDSDAVIEIDASLSTEKFYNGKNFDINVNTNFIQQKVLSDQIVDTNYYDQKLGAKISIYDPYGNRLTSTSLMGIYFEINGVNYYPRDNGEVRINIAERVANVSSKIIVHAENSNIAGGVYKMVIESFGSPDGIYYGLESSDSIELTLMVMDTLYGLIVNIPDNGLFWDKETGKNDSGSNTLYATVKYESGFSEPNIRIKMYRRDYEEVYSTKYNLVDFSEYFTNRLTATTNEFEYILSDNPVSSLTHFLYLKENLISGTYKLEFSLYDGDTHIGEVYRYIIIKEFAN